MNLRIQQLSSTSAAAPALDQLQGQLQQGLQNAGLGKDASTLVASLACFSSLKSEANAKPRFCPTTDGQRTDNFWK